MCLRRSRAQPMCLVQRPLLESENRTHALGPEVDENFSERGGKRGGSGVGPACGPTLLVAPLSLRGWHTLHTGDDGGRGGACVLGWILLPAHYRRGCFSGPGEKRNLDKACVQISAPKSHVLVKKKPRKKWWRMTYV